MDACFPNACDTISPCGQVTWSRRGTALAVPVPVPVPHSGSRCGRPSSWRLQRPCPSRVTASHGCGTGWPRVCPCARRPWMPGPPNPDARPRWSSTTAGTGRPWRGTCLATRPSRCCCACAGQVQAHRTPPPLRWPGRACGRKGSACSSPGRCLASGPKRTRAGTARACRRRRQGPHAPLPLCARPRSWPKAFVQRPVGQMPGGGCQRAQRWCGPHLPPWPALPRCWRPSLHVARPTLFAAKAGLAVAARASQPAQARLAVAHCPALSRQRCNPAGTG